MDVADRDYVTIGGVRGLDRANGIFQITLVSDNEFSLNVAFLAGEAMKGAVQQRRSIQARTAKDTVPSPSVMREALMHQPVNKAADR